MKIIRLTENDLNKIVEKIISESKYSKVVNILRGGIRKSIKTIAILTGENPFGKKTSESVNKELNNKLEFLLKSGRFGYRKIKGSYGFLENSFIINNINRDTAIEIGAKFNQESIIFGEVVEVDSNNDIFMRFELISTDRRKSKEIGKIIAKNDVFIRRDDTEEDYYSEVGGRKFLIPFYGTIERLVDPDKKIYDLKKDYSQSKWDGGKTTPTKIEKIEKIPTDDDLNELNYLEEGALGTIGSTSYYYRCRLEKKLEELNLTNLI